jgi:hypothetical protein
MLIKKSELYSSLWKSCDELRRGMDASQYKGYVLVLLFMKYVSDKAPSQKGYLLEVPNGGGFADMANAFGSDWVQLESDTLLFHDPLYKGRRFIPPWHDDAPIKGSLSQLLPSNWLPADREQGMQSCQPQP